jgi:hypothetical protein
MVQDQMTVENVDWAGGAFGGRICDSSVIDKREVAAACTYFGSMPCVESGACAPREVGIPNWAAPNPVAWHTFLSVRTVMIGQAHAATAASAIPGTFPSLLGSGSGCRGEAGS